MATELIVNASLPEIRIALMEDGEIQELLIERASDKGIVGNIYKGRVTRVLPGMQAAFVDIGLEKAAFLYVDDVYVHSEIFAEDEVEEEEPVASEPSAGSPGEAGATEPQGEQVQASGTELLPGASSPEGAQAAIPPAGGEAAGAEAVVETADTQEFDVQEAEEDIEESSEADDTDDDFDDLESEDMDSDEAEDDEDSDEDVEDDSEEDDEDEDDESEDDEDEDEEPSDDEPSSKGKKGKLPGDPEDDEDEDDRGPVRMAPKPGNEDDDNVGNRVEQPAGTVAPESAYSHGDDLSGNRIDAEPQRERAPEDTQGGAEGMMPAAETGMETGRPIAAGERVAGGNNRDSKRRHRRGRRGGRNRRHRGDRNERTDGNNMQGAEKTASNQQNENYQQYLQESGQVQSDRTELSQREENLGVSATAPESETARADVPRESQAGASPVVNPNAQNRSRRPEFREQRGRDRRIRPKMGRQARGSVNIQDLLQEGQEVLVQVAKDPIAAKGARLTCHISLPGRHLVCMPTIDHVGVSRRIERDDERRRLRDFVEHHRPRNLGFIVRTATASGKQQSERRIKQDIDYLTRLWDEIRGKASSVTSPALVYEDLNAVLRAIRDWVTEDIDKIIVDSRYHFTEIQRFVSHFMPSLRQKVELYHGDIPIFDAYGISTELSRALERKVWLKSGGYIVIDQAEALVAIDVNTGRYVGKKNLEDTILKTNLEAVQEIAYQLRLRNCGGIIILDLIDMEKEENKHRVYRALEDALKKDRARPTILKISELGLVEMTRKRTRDTMVRTLCESCSHCEGKGFVKNKTTVAYEVLRDIEREGIERDVKKVLVQAHPDVIDILAIDERETLDQLERRYRKQIFLQAVSDFHPEQFEVISEKSNQPQVYQPQRADRPERSSERSGDRENRRDRERGSREDRDSRRHGGQRHGGQHPQPRPRPPIAPITPVTVPVVEAGPGNAAEEGSLNREAGVASAPQEGILPNEGPSASNGSGNGAYPSQDTASATGSNVGIGAGSGSGDHDHFDEEDRLAFLRAQAAQDAALAGLSGNAPGAKQQQRNQKRPRDRDDRSGHGGGHGGGRNRRGRRGRFGGRDRFSNNRGSYQSRPVAPKGPSPMGEAAGPVENSAPEPSNRPSEAPSGGGGTAPVGGGDGNGGQSSS